MTPNPTIGETTTAQRAAVLALYPQAFRDEELRPLVAALLDEAEALSLAAFEGDTLIGHVVFTPCGSEGEAQGGALLGPLAVAPSRQRLGIGARLVRAGLERVAENGARQVFVLGDPTYYERFGFRPERRVLTPFAIPEEWAEAWRSTTLASRAPLAPGRLRPRPPWMDPALWGP